MGKRKAVEARRRGPGYWEALIAEFEAAPCGHDEFAARKGVNVGTFRSWLYRVRRFGPVATRQRVGPAARFVEVVSEPPKSPELVALECVVCVANVEVRFSRLPPAAYLVELLRSVGR